MDLVEILNNLKSVVEDMPKLPDIDKTLTAYAALEREGMSAMRASSRVMERQSEYMAKTSPTYSNGMENCMNHLISIIVEEVLREIRIYGRVKSEIIPNTAAMTGYAYNAGGPAPVLVTNKGVLEGTGIIC